MNIDELYLNINDSTMADIVRQVEIVTEDDVRCYQEKGYLVHLTVDSFRERFPEVDPACICYIPSFSLSCFYFNPETLVVCPFHMEVLLLGSGPVTIEGTCKEIQRRESMAQEGKFHNCVYTLTDRMRLEYFSLLVSKYGDSLPGLYSLFFDAYRLSDYGFKGLDSGTLQVILQSKTDEDRAKTVAALSDLPDTFVIYRGGNSASTDYQEAYSWTLDINTANFFACRRGHDSGYIVKAEVAKDKVIDAFLENSNEQEVIVDPRDVHIVQEIPVQGLAFLEDVIPIVNPMYQTYKEMLYKLKFLHDSELHGKAHSARVLLLTQIIAEMLDLSLKERHLLAMAAIFHDTQRSHDGEDPCHGEAARGYYFRNVVKPDSLVEFLCKYHCLPDEEGYAAIRNNRKLSRNRTQATRLLQVLKDADALDRIRLGGIRALDMNQLRLDVSKQLTLVARMCLEQVKV